jgi:hypothetical protein
VKTVWSKTTLIKKFVQYLKCFHYLVQPLCICRLTVSLRKQQKSCFRQQDADIQINLKDSDGIAVCLGYMPGRRVAEVAALTRHTNWHAREDNKSKNTSSGVMPCILVGHFFVSEEPVVSIFRV